MTHLPQDYLNLKTCSKTLRYDTYYIDLAYRTSLLSYDSRIKVGSVIVKDGQLVSQGWNGVPAGMDNNTRDEDGVTKPEVIHSEANALMKLAKNGGGSNGATLYCTHSPCFECAKLILQAGVKRVVYSEVYCENSLRFMKERGLILVELRRSNQLSSQEDREY